MLQCLLIRDKPLVLADRKLTKVFGGVEVLVRILGLSLLDYSYWFCLGFCLTICHSL